MDLLLLQLGLWEYQTHFGHPMMEIIKGSVSSFVGEDVELFNRLLCQKTQHSRRGEPNEAYQTLGVLVQNGMEFIQDLLDKEVL